MAATVTPIHPSLTVADYAAQVVAAAPPLNAAQIDKLAAIITRAGNTPQPVAA